MIQLMSNIEVPTKAAPDLSRREFLMTISASAGCMLAAGSVRADIITTGTAGLMAGDAGGIKVRDGNMPYYAAAPIGVSKPPVIIVAPEIFGLHEYIKDVVRRIAKLGALAVAPDYYFRQGDLTKITDVSELLRLVDTKADAELVSDLNTTVEWATAGATGGDPGRLGIIGFGRGGRTVWIYASANPNLRAGVAFYGPLADVPSTTMPKNPIMLASEMKAPVLGLFGDADQDIPVAQLEAMKAALQAAGKTFDFKVYPGAPGGFHADYRTSYRRDSAEDAWKMMQAWFRKYNVLG